VFYSLKRNNKWKAIREETRKAAGDKCEICGIKRDRNMICHEEWTYDMPNRVATITRFRWICPDCNGVIHIAGGPISWSDGLEKDPNIKVIEHLMHVNEISLREALDLLNKENQKNEERSKLDWKIRLDKTLTAQFPFLQDLDI
jgi:hypothetical protein